MSGNTTILRMKLWVWLYVRCQRSTSQWGHMAFHKHTFMSRDQFRSNRTAFQSKCIEMCILQWILCVLQNMDPERRAAKVQATSDLMQKLTNNKAKFPIHTKGRQPPTAAETRRIAKIFSEKYWSAVYFLSISHELYLQRFEFVLVTKSIHLKY